MKKRILQPEQIIIPGEYYLGDESILKIYFRIFDKGHGTDLPPVLVINYRDHSIDDMIEGELCKDLKMAEEYENPFRFRMEGIKGIEKDREYHRKRAHENAESKRKEFLKLKEVLENHVTKGSSYLLLDGNHKSTAAALVHQPISALEIMSDEDLNTIRRMVEEGKLFDFKRREKTISELMKEYYDFLMNHIRDVDTLKSRAHKLTSNGDLPQYMKDRYHKGK